MKQNLNVNAVMPESVLIIGTYDKDGRPNAMNVAWGGRSDTKEITLNLSEHKTNANMKLNQAFTVAFATEDTLASSDYVGLVSGNKVPDKVEKAHLTAKKAPHVNAPYFEEYPLTLECKLLRFEEDHDQIRAIGEIVNAIVDDRILTNGKIDADKAHFLVLDENTGTYRVIGKSVGKAFHDGLALR